MPLTGQAKTDYQRYYMRKRRSNIRLISVRPEGVVFIPIGSNRPDSVRPGPGPEVNVITKTSSGLAPEPCAYTEAKKISSRLRKHVELVPANTPYTADDLALDGYPIQQKNSITKNSMLI